MSGRKVTKDSFSRHLRQVASSGESGLFTIVTDAQRSVLLRISEGRITSSRCRGREIDKAIAVLIASVTLRYSFVRAEPENHPELIGIDDFLRRIGAGEGPVSDARRQRARGAAAPSPGASPRQRAGADDVVRATLEEIAVDVIGPVAQLVVDEALSNNATVKGAINEIARAIPDTQVASEFLEAVRERIPDIAEDS